MSETGTAAQSAGNTQQGTAGTGAGITEEAYKGLQRESGQKLAAAAAELANLKAELEQAKAGSAEAATLKAELAKTQKLANYADIQAFLKKSFDRGLDPDKVDDEYVAEIRAGRKTAEEVISNPGHNPARGSTTAEDDADKLLRAIPSLVS